MTVPAYALYYVCEDIDGTCLYRRQDVSLEVELKALVSQWRLNTTETPWASFSG